MDAPSDDRSRREQAVAVGAALSLGALVIAVLLVPVRTELANANVAILLMGFVVAAGFLGGRFASVAVAATSATAFNFFHTRPYNTLKMTDGNDILALILLVVCGLVVGELAAQRARRIALVEAQRREIAMLDRLASVAAAAPLVDTWRFAQTEIARVLAAEDVWFERAHEPSASGALPWIDRRGVHGSRVHRWTGNGFAIPTEGVQIPVGVDASRGRIVAHSLARRSVGASAYSYACAVAGVLALAIDRRPNEADGIAAP